MVGPWLARNPVAVPERCRPDSCDMADSYRQPSEQTRRWVEAALGSNAQVLAASRLIGGLTADMDRLTIAAGRSRFDVVLRRWSDSKWANWATGLLDRETAGLTALAGHDLPVPRLLAVDRTGEQAGVPCLLMTALPYPHSALKGFPKGRRALHVPQATATIHGQRSARQRGSFARQGSRRASHVQQRTVNRGPWRALTLRYLAWSRRWAGTASNRRPSAFLPECHGGDFPNAPSMHWHAATVDA
jgi:hypothetical protein